VKWGRNGRLWGALRTGGHVVWWIGLIFQFELLLSFFCLRHVRPSPPPWAGEVQRACAHSAMSCAQCALSGRVDQLFLRATEPSPCSLFRSSLSARLDEMSLPPASQLPKANHFLAYLALLAGPEALSCPATAQKSLERGRSPACAPPAGAAVCAPPWLGYAPTCGAEWGPPYWGPGQQP
jgi:hypothetical protein